MTSKIKIAQFFGIPVYVHWSFMLLFFWIGYLTLTMGLGLKFFTWYSALFIAIFICVVLHEFGHALTAKKFGVATRDIILSPIGGIARLEKLPEKPIQEFLVAIAGPLVNVVIFLVLYLFHVLFDYGNIQLWELGFREMMFELLNGSFFTFLFTTMIGLNLGLAVFNMIPAFPMDGGRILRSLLAIKFSRVRATQVATIVAQILAIAGFVFAIMGTQIILSLICVFIFLAARSENKMVKLDEVLEKTLVSEIVEMNFTRIYQFDLVQSATSVLKLGRENHFLVLRSEEEQEVIGVLHQAVLMQAIKKSDEFTAVQNYISPRFEYVKAEDNLKTIIPLMQKEGYTILPVVDEANVLIGKIDMDGLNAFLRMQQKIKKAQS